LPCPISQSALACVGFDNIGFDNKRIWKDKGSQLLSIYTETFSIAMSGVVVNLNTLPSVLVVDDAQPSV
jgi:hypothetical protein